MTAAKCWSQCHLLFFQNILGVSETPLMQDCGHVKLHTDATNQDIASCTVTEIGMKTTDVILAVTYI